MLRAVPFFFGKMKAEQQQLCEKEAAVRTKANGLDAINQTVGMIGYLGAVLILVVSVLKGSISVGAFAAVYYALNSLFDMVFALVCGFLGSAVGSLPAVENYVAFLEKDPDRSWKDVPRMGKAMQFSDVSFTYPSAKEPSIEHLNLTIPEKEHLAIVGGERSGKIDVGKTDSGAVPTDTRGCDSGGWSSDAAVRRGTGNHAGRLYRALCRVPELHEIPDDAAGQCDDQRPEKECAGKTAAGANGLKAGSSCAVQRTDAVAGV